MQQGAPGAEHCPSPPSGQLHPRGKLSPGRAPSSPGAGCLQEQGAGALRASIREGRLGGGCWRRDCSSLVEQPGPGGERLLPLGSPSSCQPAAGTWREAAQGTGADSEPWRKGSAPASPLNYSSLGGEGSCQRHAAAVSSFPSVFIPIPPLPWGELRGCHSADPRGLQRGEAKKKGRGEHNPPKPLHTRGTLCSSPRGSKPWLPADGQQPCSHPKASSSRPERRSDLVPCLS